MTFIALTSGRHTAADVALRNASILEALHNIDWFQRFTKCVSGAIQTSIGSRRSARTTTVMQYYGIAVWEGQ